MAAAETARGGLHRGVGPGAEQASLGARNTGGRPGTMRTSLPSPVPTAASPDPEGPGPQPALTRLLLVFQLLGPPALDLKIQEPQWGPENRLGSPGLVLGVGAVCPWPEHLGALRASTRGTGQGWYLQEVVFGLGVKVALNSPGGRTRLRGDRCRQGVRLPCLPGLPAPPGGMVPREPWVGGLTPAGDGPAEPSALRGGSEEPERGLGLCKDSAELKVAVRQVMEASGAARPACGQKPQLSGAAATCPASRGRVGPAGPRPESCAAGCSPDPARAGPGLRDPGPRAPRGGRTENNKRTGRGAGARPAREAALQGPGPRGSRCPEVRARLCGGPGRGAGRSRSSLSTRPSRRRAVGLTQASRGSSGGTPSPNTQGQTAGPHWPKHTLAPQWLCRAKVPGPGLAELLRAGPGGSPTPEATRSQRCLKVALCSGVGGLWSRMESGPSRCP